MEETFETPKDSNYVIPWFLFVEDGIYLTKEKGDSQEICFGRVFEYIPFDMGSMDAVAIAEKLRAIRSTFRFCDDDWSINVHTIAQTHKDIPSYCHKDAPPAVQQFEKHHVAALAEYHTNRFFLTFNMWMRPGKKSSDLMFNSGVSEESLIDRDLKKFMANTDDIMGMLRSAFRSVKSLNRNECTTFLHGLISTRWFDVKAGVYIDDTINDIGINQDPFYIYERKSHPVHVLVASIKNFPDTTKDGFLTKIMSKNIDFTMSSVFKFYSKEKAKAILENFRKQAYKKRKGFGAVISETVTKEASALEDTEMLQYTNEASEAISMLAASDVQFGEFRSVLIIKDENYDRAVENMKELKKVFNDKGYIVKEEGLGAAPMWFGSFPGQRFDRYGARKYPFGSRNFLHFIPPSAPWPGIKNNIVIEEAMDKGHIKKDPAAYGFPLLYGKASTSLFALNLCPGTDLMHTFVIGPSGAGKSILFSVMAYGFLRYPDARVVFFDKDKSCLTANKNAGGIFYDIATKTTDFKLNPFFGIADDGYRRWLSNYLCDYFKSRGIELDAKAALEVSESLEDLSHQDPDHHDFETFSRVVQNSAIRIELQNFISGAFSHIFKSGPDNFNVNQFVSFEMATLISQGEDITRFVLGYLFQKLEIFFDGRPTFLFLDEAWLMLKNPVFAARIFEWIKVLRKRRVAVILATQDVSDLKGDLFVPIINNCPTKIILPNSRARDPENLNLYRQIGLSDSDIYNVATATPKRDYYYISDLGKQLFTLCLDSKQLDLIKNEWKPSA